jgi:hypothetical protein
MYATYFLVVTTKSISIVFGHLSKAFVFEWLMRGLNAKSQFSAKVLRLTDLGRGLSPFPDPLIIATPNF